MKYYISDLHFGHEKEEIWKPIKGYEGLYEVSNLGRVKRLAYSKEISPRGYSQTMHFKEKLLKPHYSKRYVQVGLCKGGSQSLALVHRLVAEAFIPNPSNLACVNHKDENKHNNKVDNLEWCTYKYNLNYGEGYKIHTNIIRTKYGKSIDQYSKDGVFIKTYECANDVEPEYSVSHVISCCKGNRKTHKNFIWKYHTE